MKKRIFHSFFACILTLSFALPAFAAIRVEQDGQEILVSHRPEGSDAIAVDGMMQDIAAAVAKVPNKEKSASI